MTCCSSSNDSCEGINSFFSRWSKSYAKKFRRRGLEKVQKHILEGIKRESIPNMNILEIGCGVGSLHLTLLKGGAVKSIGIDISEGMLEQAKKFATSMGVNDRAEYHLGDFVELAPKLADGDVTMLDKVVCCYEDLPALIERSTDKTRYVYALSHPREKFTVRTVFKSQIALAKLFQWKFRPFWHNWAAMHQRILDRGFELAYQKSTFVWQVNIYRRLQRAAA